MSLRRWVVSGAAYALGVSLCAATLPLVTDFESVEGYAPGPTPSGDRWTFSSTLTATVATGGYAGDQALALAGAGWLDFPIDASVPNFSTAVTWVDFYLKPVFAGVGLLPANLDESFAAVTGFVKVDSTGEVYVLNGDGQGGGQWTASGFTATLSDGRALDWLRVSYRVDYGNKRWDLFLNGDLILADLGFVKGNATSFVQLRLNASPDKASLLDSLYMGAENPLFTDTSGDGLPDSWLLAHGLDPATFQRYADPDHDGVDNLTEFRLGLSPNSPDTDNDGVYDRRELRWGANPKVADVRSLGTVPFADGFETDAPGPFATGTRGWLVQAGEQAAVEIATGAGNPEGALSLSLSGASTAVERHFADTTRASVVWLDFYMKGSSRIEPPAEIPADVAAVFYFTSEGKVMVLDGGGQGGGEWRTLEFTVSAWNHVSLRMDYANQRWSIWFNGIRYGHNLGFAHAVPYFSGFALKHSDWTAAGLDGFRVLHTEPVHLDNDGDGLTNSEESTHGTNPDSIDSDGDGISDPVELQIGLTPTVPETYVARLVNEGNGVFAWRTSFAVNEGYVPGGLNGQLGWQASGATVATTEQGHVSAVAGATGVMERYLGANGLAQVWVTFRARLKAGALPQSSALSGPAASLFGFTREKSLAIYDSAQAKWVEHTVTASAGEWNDYALYLDYRTQHWLLVLNGTLIARDLSFRDGGLSTITRFRMIQTSGEGGEEAQEAALDDLVVSNAEPAGFDFDGDGLTNAQERALGLDPFKADTDGDGLPDNWEVANGLNPVVADSSGDLDGDGFANGVEFQHGTNPNEATTALPGFAHWDEWQALAGTTVVTLTGDARFPGSPDYRALLAGLELPSGRGTNYGTRLRAWLKPTVDGEHVFWIAGDDTAELWLSSDETPFARRRIACTTAATSAREWERYPATQRSDAVTLQAGARYYVEVLHKQSTSTGHVAVAWQAPGGSRVQLPAAVLEAFPRFANDQDEDGLPDDWERAHGLTVGSGGAPHGAYGDLDQDGVLNFEEYSLGLRPNAGDTDGDGLADGFEIDAGTSATSPTDTGLSLSPWQVSSVGSPQQASGTIKSPTGSIWIMGNEAGPVTSGDTYKFVNQPISGDFDLAVAFRRTDNLEGSFGLIVRDGLGNKAACAYLECVRTDYYRFYSRAVANGPLTRYAKNSEIALPAVADGYWVRLRRQGSVLSGYYSADGETWTYLGGAIQNLPASCLVGFATWNAVATPTVREVTRIKLRLDRDGDGLYDDQEALLGTSSDLSDTDGDGLSDYEEVIDIGTDAAGANVSPTEVAVYAGSAGVPVSGTWSTSGGSLRSVTPLGTVQYAVTLPTAGVYRVQLDVTCRTNISADYYLPFDFSVDGQFIRREEVLIPAGTSRPVTVTLPWLAAGEHQVSVFYDNTLTYRMIAYETLRLQSIGGVDTNSNGRPDWVDARLAGANRVFEPAPVSHVSPLCLEGVSRYRSMMAVKVGETSLPHSLAPGMGWYADVPLSPSGTTVIDTSFEGGAVATRNVVEWTPLNLLVDAASLPEGRLVVRKNDTLRLSAVPADEVNQGGVSSLRIVKSGVTLLQQSLGSAVQDFAQYTFPSAGIFQITAEYDSGVYSQTGTITVEVVDAQFSGNPVVGLNRPYTWKNTLLGSGAVVETDDGLVLDQATALTPTGWQFRAINESLVPKSVVARAGQDGAVLARAELTALRVSTDAETSTDLITTYSNGTKLIETPIILSQLPDGLKVVVEIFVSGVTFEDGSVKKTLYASDFDEIGRAYLRFVYPAGLSSSYCHRTQVYIGTVHLGAL